MANVQKLGVKMLHNRHTDHFSKI